MRLGAVTLVALMVSLSAFAADPFVGTWKPNVDKWKLSSGAPERRKSELITFESAGKDQYRRIITTLDGKATSSANIQPEVCIVDGKEITIDVGFKSKASNASTNGILGSLPQTAREMRLLDYVVSAEGKTLTVIRKGTVRLPVGPWTNSSFTRSSSDWLARHSTLTHVQGRFFSLSLSAWQIATAPSERILL